SGTSAENIIWLYEELGLYRDSLSRLQARPWHVKARAIQELAEMKQDRCTAELLAATNHKNYFVRTEAKIALVRIIGFEGLRFLDIATYPITEWQQLCLLQELVHRHDFRWEQLQAWLRSPNETVVEFALRLIEVYQCFELHDSASVCLSSAAPLIQCQAVKTLGAVAWEDTPALLIERFPSLDVQAQRVALQVLQPLTSAASLPFFRSLEGHPDLLVRHRAARLAARLEQQATHRSDKSIPSAETV
ncbi:MAG TPA: hypothetical protein VHK69_10375, partial [Chitinophagaceae bacterium]|nr:hypothetical protein [Chitinophagaceae bacterium]